MKVRCAAKGCNELSARLFSPAWPLCEKHLAEAEALIAEHEEEPPAMKASEMSFNEAIIRVAAVHNRTVQFRYAKGEGEMIETRTIEPQRIVTPWTFNGYDPDRGEARSYRLDRIKGDVRVV